MIAYVPSFAKEAIDRGFGETVRGVEVYESDGVTPWQDGLSDRLIDGSVSINYGDNERRTLDITLSNTDNLLRSSPNGFWYDKVFKLYRGVQFPAIYVNPRYAVIEASTSTIGSRTVAWLSQLGLTRGVNLSVVPPLNELNGYDIIVSYTGNASTANAATLQSLYNMGRTIITISNTNLTAQVPHLGTSTSKSDDWGVNQMPTANVLSAGWTSQGVSGTTTGSAVTTMLGTGLAVARWQMNDASYAITASIATNNIGGRWFDLHLPNYGDGTAAQINQLVANAIAWIKDTENARYWRTQIGEFCIDSISNPHFPSNVKITGRDYTKRCMGSKIESAMSFDSGTNIGVLITALAANAGITKFRLATMLETIGTSLTFDRGTPRWEVMSQAAKTQGYEIFFDQEGYLVTRKFLDPTLSAASYVFQTGVEGNLSTIDRVVNDTRIYNHIAVYGDPSSGETRFPYFGEAKNENPSSPTRIGRIGDRYYSFASTFFTSQQQTQEYADRLLSVHGLESFELSFSAICYPWLEVGEIGKVIDPKAVDTDPTQYLVDSGTIPLALGPMSFTGKRVTIVG